ncbi:uncharacterized protein L969DRAFT_53195 [Mixia osmundae IAM 14324]|uniref:FAD-binding FR-type domain-containing protein n=1 Tax=Mixia osmundae (strain CBS 9802 / IAM 14324 / JCM 22182 / KY 12970) TaxID=764103 RepID=G7DWJ8_MIXOS|nr:uncharacterized protein L969DRAFT_53195 [Mixia osmundae IAM 14324]KEI37359.1 hypothetical protein L969DRAFT_53195 [Mixia osmundae IAM 14324]GAA94958.1 hypothetical protein E5Q_01613 [Mixia osmundae IAM 14324]
MSENGLMTLQQFLRGSIRRQATRYAFMTDRPQRMLVAARHCRRISAEHARQLTTAPQSASRQWPSPHWLGVGAVLSGLTTIWLYQQGKPKQPGYLSATYFRRLTINAVDKINEDTSVFSLELPTDHLAPSSVRPEALQSIHVIQPELQIERPLTPLDLDALDAHSSNRQLRLLVRRYEDGEMSKYLHRLGVGSQLFVRGPTDTYSLAQLPQSTRIIFLVAGTGVTPAIQALHEYARTPDISPQIDLIYCSRDEKAVYLRDELEELKAKLGKRLTIRHHLVASSGRLTIKQLKRICGSPNAAKPIKILVCGPESMVKELAGPRALDRSDGPLGGLLAQAGYSAFQVKKL